MCFHLVYSCRALALNCDAALNDKDGAESKNWRAGKPVRVVRSSKGRRISKYAPEDGNRYDGIYKVLHPGERGKTALGKLLARTVLIDVMVFVYGFKFITYLRLMMIDDEITGNKVILLFLGVL